MNNNSIECYFGHSKIFAQEGIDFSQLDPIFAAKSLDILSKIDITPISNSNMIPLSNLASGREFEGGLEHRTGVYTGVHEDSSTEPTRKLPAEVELQKRSIPLVTHHIYITSNKSPKYIDKIPANIALHSISTLNNLSNQWIHYIWTNNINIIPATLINITQIKLIDELSSSILWKEFTATLKQAEEDFSLFVKASDILRYITLNQYGGIYLDLDYQIYNPENLLKLLSKANFLVGKDEPNNKSVGNSFIAATPNHPITNELINLAKRNLNKDRFPNIPEYQKYPCRKVDALLFQTGPAAITIAFYKLANISTDLLMPRQVLYNHEYIRANTIESKCYKPNPSLSLNFSINNLNIQTIGADIMCGSWNRKKDYYFDFIEYNENISRIEFINHRIFASLQENDITLLKYDLQNISNINQVTENNITLLAKATSLENIEAVDIILKAKANPNLFSKDKITPLYIAATLGNSVITKKLLEAEADPNITKDDGSNAILMAVANGHKDVAKLLLDAGANTKIAIAGISLETIASYKQDHEMIGLLKSYDLSES